MSLRRLALGVFLAVAAVLNTCRAWDITGHMAVAWIAAQDFDDALQKRIIALLEQHPAFRDQSYRLNWRRNLPANLTQQQYCAFLLMQAAEWPDSLRDRTAKLLDPDTGKPISLEADAHYINLPLGDSRHFPERIEGHIIQKLDYCMQTLRTPAASPSQQSQSLSWLCHLIGDLHQPLHCVGYYSPFLPQGDHGANSILAVDKPVTLQPPFNSNSKFPSLHHFWDEVLGKTAKFDEIGALGQDLMRTHTRAQLAPELQVTGFMRWAEEGRAIADGWGYRYQGQAVPCLAKSDVENRLKRNEAVAIPVLPAGYIDLAQQIARHRVALAGYRLGDQLRVAFSQ